MKQKDSFRTVDRRVMGASLVINLIGAIAAGLYLTFIDPLPSAALAVEEIDPVRM